MSRKIGNGWFAIRFEVLARDDFACQYCGQFAPNVILEVDHRIALVDGGDDSLDNLVTSCRACNRGKEGLRVRSRRRVAKPRSTYGGGVTRSGTQDGSITALVRDYFRAHPDATSEATAQAVGTTQATIRTIRARLRARGELGVSDGKD